MNYRELRRRGFVDSSGRPMNFRAMSASGGYRGASTGYRMSTWRPGALGPNRIAERDLWLLVARTRDAVRNNSHAKSASDTFASNLVGTGIIPRWPHLRTYLQENMGLSEGKAKDITYQLTDEWHRWTQSADGDGVRDFYGLQTIVAKSLLSGGEIFARMRTRPLSRGLRVPLQIQLIEGEQLDESKGHMGIETRRTGGRIAYWFFPQHPGDSEFSSSGQPRRVPADEVAHAYLADRPGQLRGVPLLATVLTRLHLLDEFEDATAVAQKIQALFAAFIKSDLPQNEYEPGIFLDERDKEFAESTGIITLEPGIVQRLEAGEDITFSKPDAAANNFVDYIRSQLRAIGAGIGLTYEQLTGDLTGVNYSSIRAGLLESRRKMEQIQHQVVIHMFCRPIINSWLEHLNAAGFLNMPGYAENPWPYRDVAWAPPGWGWVDPLKETMADQLDVECGFTSRTRVIAKRGYDREDIDSELEDEAKDLASSERKDIQGFARDMILSEHK